MDASRPRCKQWTSQHAHLRYCCCCWSRSVRSSRSNNNDVITLATVFAISDWHALWTSSHHIANTPTLHCSMSARTTHNHLPDPGSITTLIHTSNWWRQNVNGLDLTATTIKHNLCHIMHLGFQFTTKSWYFDKVYNTFASWIASWLHGTVVERRSGTGKRSLSRAQPAADRSPLVWVNHPL